MSSSASPSVTNIASTVAYTLTYTLPSASTPTTATVLGQVLYNGQTNYIPSGTSQAAIYLATVSASGASVTEVGGQTYYWSTGTAVPDLVTGITASSSSGSSGSGTSTRSGSGSSRVQSTGTSTGSSTGSGTGTESAASATKTSGAGRLREMGVGKALVVGLCVAFMVAGY